MLIGTIYLQVGFLVKEMVEIEKMVKAIAFSSYYF